MQRGSVTYPQLESSGNRIPTPVSHAEWSTQPEASCYSPPTGPVTSLSPRLPLDVRPQWKVISKGPVSLGPGKLSPRLHARVAVPGQVAAAARASPEPPRRPPESPLHTAVCSCGSPPWVTVSAFLRRQATEQRGLAGAGGRGCLKGTGWKHLAGECV